jgi:hypothetical protein
MMRHYLSHHPDRRGSFSPEELDMLDALVKRAIERLGLTDEGDRNEAAARILSLYMIGGRSPDEILELAIRLHRNGLTPGGRRSTTPSAKRIRASA